MSENSFGSVSEVSVDVSRENVLVPWKDISLLPSH